MPSIEPSPEQLQTLLADSRDDAPVVMINLLRYRDRAAYPPDAGAGACSGREAYERYGAAVMPMLAAVGAKVVWRATVTRTVIGPGDDRWDDAILVQYPSRKAFLTMVSSPDYQRVSVHRAAALADSRLLATEAVSSGLMPTGVGVSRSR
jgi:uncharacterized protein (DUF1330 family)